MKRYNIPYRNTNKFSDLILDYIDQKKDLNKFINHFPSIENVDLQIKEKSSQVVDRKILFDVLNRQNKEVPLSEKSKKNLSLISLNNTFTITTGHQICLFTGPLYFIYKIISTINLTEKLKEKYPKYNFVPIFWMASEDHDFEEINHINIFSKTIEWKGKKGGAVGRMSIDKINSAIDELKTLIGLDKNSEKILSIIKTSYLNQENFASATRLFINNLFKQYGLLIIDGDDKRLKKEFITFFKKDIIENEYKKYIKNTTNDIVSQKYKAQAFFRNINCFKLLDESRELIQSKLSEEEIDNNYYNISPNVLLRPLYQELILPNIAYVGGSSEIAYWMQLRDLFKKEKVSFPLLFLRNSCTVIDEKKLNRFLSLGFKIDDIFISTDELHKKYVLDNKQDISLNIQVNKIQYFYEEILLKTSDKSIKTNIKAELKKQLNILKKIEKKIIKSNKENFKIQLNQISSFKNLLFPKKTLQERHDNFISFYLRYGDNFIKTLKDNLDPLNTNFVVLALDNKK